VPSPRLLCSCGEFAVDFSDAASRLRLLGPIRVLGERLCVGEREGHGGLQPALCPVAYVSQWGNSSALPLISTWLQDSQWLPRSQHCPT